MNRCRLCAELVDMSSCCRFSENPRMLGIIENMLSIVIQSGDSLPQQICPTCVDRLSSLDEFMKTTEEADWKLREILCEEKEPGVEISNRVIVFSTFLTPAVKRYVNQPVFERFIINVLEPNVILSCKTCKRTYLSESAAVNHLCDSHKTKDNVTKKPNERTQFVCEFCNRVFKYEKELSLHKVIHTNSSSPVEALENETHSCSFCSKSFTRKTKKISHEMTHLANCF